jgi:protein-disulfide isomerase
VVYKHFIVNPQAATIPALASCAAALQGKFTELEHLIWEKGFKAQDLSADNMEKLAKEAKLDMTRFAADMKGSACAERIQQDQDDLARFGVNGTPAFFINGRHLSGARPIGHFKKLIDEELAKAEAASAAGTQVEDYYRVAVLEKGLKELAAPQAAAK